MTPQTVHRSNPGHLVIGAHSPVSGRHAVLEGNGYSTWLYLTEPGSEKLCADCFLFSVVPPVGKLMKPFGEAGPPILLKRFATLQAYQPAVIADHLNLEFSPDGHSIVVSLRNQPWALIAHGVSQGYSKAISENGPFGLAWSDQAFRVSFVKPKGS